MSEIPSIAGNFKHIVPVATCQNTTQPYVETNYTFPTFDEWLAGKNSSISSEVSSSTSLPSVSTPTLSGTITSRPVLSDTSTTSSSSAESHSSHQSSTADKANSKSGGGRVGVTPILPSLTLILICAFWSI